MNGVVTGKMSAGMGTKSHTAKLDLPGTQTRCLRTCSVEIVTCFVTLVSGEFYTILCPARPQIRLAQDLAAGGIRPHTMFSEEGATFKVTPVHTCRLFQPNYALTPFVRLTVHPMRMGPIVGWLVGVRSHNESSHKFIWIWMYNWQTP